MLFALISPCTGREQHDERAQALATAHHDVLGYLGHERNVAIEARGYQAIDGLHIVVGERRDVVEVHGIGCFFGHLHKFCDNA